MIGGEELVVAPHLLHVGGVGVDVVTQEDEEVGLARDDGVPDRLRLVLVGTRAEGDSRRR